MNRYSLKIFLVIMLFGPKSFSQEPSRVVYRVIHTSPNEFVSALRAPMPTQAPKSAQGQQSRLQKYFRVTWKEVRQNSIQLRLLPNLPLLPEYFEELTSIDVTLKEKEKTENEFHFGTEFEMKGHKFVHADMKITPRPEGSLLKLELQESNYSPWMLKGFFDLAIKLGFASDEQTIRPIPSKESEKK